MFAWLRILYNGGKVPPKPCDEDLDWPDEEQWVFDYDAWKWVAEAKTETETENPFNSGWEERWDDISENSPVNIDDIPHAVILDEEPSKPRCCGGVCHMQPPPVTSTSQTEPPSSACQQPISVTR